MGRKPFDKIFTLVGKILTDTLGDRDGGTLEFKDTDGDAVDV